MPLLHRAVLGDLRDMHRAFFDLVDLGIGDPLDVMVAHLAFEKAFRVAHPVKTEMADIGF